MKPRVLAINREGSGVAYHRIKAPLQHLHDNNEIELKLLDSKNPLQPKDLEGVTHFIVSRFLQVKQPLRLVQLLRNHNVKIIVDQDDWWELPPNHPAKGRYELVIKHQIKYANYIADEVWVTHKELAKMVDNKNVQIIPNAINHHEPQWKEPKIKSDILRFGYIAGISHTEDLANAKIDLDHREGSYCVNVENYPNQINAKHILETKPVHEYATLYADLDVSLVPLNVNKFNRCKSNLKMLEAGFTNTAVIVSNVHPYTQLIKDDNCISLPPKGDWNKAINELSKDEVEAIAYNLSEDVWEYRMDNINLLRSKRLKMMFK